MPITKSAKKALRQNADRKYGNTVCRKKMKSLLKKARELVVGNKKEEAKALLPEIYKAMDKAAKKGVIKKNTASRTKSRITKLLNKQA